MNREIEQDSNETDNHLLKPMNRSGGNKEKKRHTCDVCAKEFKKKDHLTRHKFIHLSTRPFSCEVGWFRSTKTSLQPQITESFRFVRRLLQERII